MKRKAFSAILACLVLFLMSCESTAQPMPAVSFSDAIKEPTTYFYKYRYFTNGVVVFHQVKDGVSVAVVTTHPLPKINKDELAEDQIMAIKLPTSCRVTVGDILTARGIIRTTKNNGKTLYYLKADKIEITAWEDVQDPDFEAVVNAVAKKAHEDAAELFLIYWFFFMNPSFYSIK